MQIKQNNLNHPKIIKLLNQHVEEMAHHSPPESIHALDIESLKKSDLTFWSLWNQQDLLGFGALKHLNTNTGEIKSMRTTPASRRKGVAKKLLNHIINEAKLRRYNKLYLETGSMQAFLPARKLYESFGFGYCQPFADYKFDENSVFMNLKLNRA